jgi:hypothetical protein
LGARIEGWFKRPKKGRQIRKNKKNLQLLMVGGTDRRMVQKTEERTADKKE